MRRRVYLGEFSCEGFSGFDLEWLRGFRVLLLDANVLKDAAEGSAEAGFLRDLMMGCVEVHPGAVCCVPDFVRLEAFNMERYLFGSCSVRRFLRDVEKSRGGLYVEFKTPVRRVPADNRKIVLDVFPKEARRVLIREFPELSGTDCSLLLLAYVLRDCEVTVLLVSRDGVLGEAAATFGIPVSEPSGLREALTRLGGLKSGGESEA